MSRTRNLLKSRPFQIGLLILVWGLVIDLTIRLGGVILMLLAFAQKL